jgi:SAM-dependent methyltransferase
MRSRVARRIGRPLPSSVKRGYRFAERAYLRAASSSRVGRRHIFAGYFRSNRWGDPQSRSGRGSNLDETKVIRRALPELFDQLGIESLLDIPCGDGSWMKHVEHNLQRYVGADLVPRAVETLRRSAGPREEYLCLDAICDPLPRTDAIFCRDLFIHLSYDHIMATLLNMKRSGAKYLIASTYPAQSNEDITTGLWRPVNLSSPPFSLGDTLHLIHEGSASEVYPDKSLGVWSLEDLPI